MTITKIRKGTKKWGLIQSAKLVTDQYAKAGMKLTLRQIYYRLVAAEVIPNVKASYQSLGKALTDARKNRIIDPEVFEDRTRTSEMETDNVYVMESMWKSWIEDLENKVNGYEIDRWAWQRNKVFVVLEKQALQSVFAAMCDKLGVTLIVNRGYNSYTQIYEIAKQIKEKAMKEVPRNAKNMVFLTFGDHDPSGRDIMRNFQQQLNDEEIYGRFKHCSLTLEQIEQYDLPPAYVKREDARAKKFIREFGDAMVELDALEPAVLQQLVKDEVDKFFDFDAYNDDILTHQKTHLKYFKSQFYDSGIKNTIDEAKKEEED
ncbi:hypothetical protein LCGC14_0176480 [marine sediment metagenome]|uniref:Uncharacterized protein n=1 Tax=marine sediment metagenome TaxID=412755 RepID=A0A0F9UVP9_9ZZZZ